MKDLRGKKIQKPILTISNILKTLRNFGGAICHDGKEVYEPGKMTELPHSIFVYLIQNKLIYKNSELDEKTWGELK